MRENSARDICDGQTEPGHETRGGRQEGERGETGQADQESSEDQEKNSETENQGGNSVKSQLARVRGPNGGCG